MIELRMLGTVNVTGGDRRELRNLLGQTRRLALLAYLAAARPRGPQRRDRLMALFWPELDQEHARAALRQALHVLRAGLGPRAIATRGEDVVVLERGAVWSDVAAFDDAVAARCEQDALDLYRGDFLDAFFITGAPDFERWVESERTRLQGAAADAARALVDRTARSGDLAAAASWASGAMRVAPLDEDLVRRLISLLDRMGDSAGALRVFDEFAKRLAAELEVQPEPKTRALAGSIRSRQQATPPAGLPWTGAPHEAVAPGPLSQGVPAAAPTAEPALVAAAASARPLIPALTELSPQRSAGIRSGPRSRHLFWPALLAGGLAVGIILAVSLLRERLGSRQATPVLRSLAVLPLEDVSGDAPQGMFAEALNEALTTDLGRTRGLRVISRRSANAWKATTKPSTAIGRELKVDALVEGSVQRSGDRIRVDVRLVRTLTGEQVWAARFEGASRDRFALEDAVSRGVRAALGFPSVAERGPPTSSPEAYDLYLLGKIALRQEGPEDNRKAIDSLERAVALDPDFAAAQAELSHAYGQRVSHFAPNDAVALDRSELAAQKALRLDPELAEAHYAAAHLMWGVRPDRFQHERAVRESKRALAVNPNLAGAHHFLGGVYLHIGLLDEATAEFEKTLSLEPSDDNALRRLGVALIYRGRYDEGLRTIRQVPSQSSASLWHYQVAWALLYLGRNDEAWMLMEEYLRIHPEDRGGVVTSTRAIWFARAGDTRRAEEDIRTAIEKGKGFIHFHHSAYNIASAYALLGHVASAVQWLRTAAETGWPCYPYFTNDPNLASLHGDPGYEAFMRELKAQWERFRLTL